MNNEIGYLAEEMYKQSIEGAACFFLFAYSKLWRETERDRESLNKKEP